MSVLDRNFVDYLYCEEKYIILGISDHLPWNDDTMVASLGNITGQAERLCRIYLFRTVNSRRTGLRKNGRFEKRKKQLSIRL